MPGKSKKSKKNGGKTSGNLGNTDRAGKDSATHSVHPDITPLPENSTENASLTSGISGGTHHSNASDQSSAFTTTYPITESFYNNMEFLNLFANGSPLPRYITAYKERIQCMLESAYPEESRATTPPKKTKRKKSESPSTPTQDSNSAENDRQRLHTLLKHISKFEENVKNLSGKILTYEERSPSSQDTQLADAQQVCQLLDSYIDIKIVLEKLSVYTQELAYFEKTAHKKADNANFDTQLALLWADQHTQLKTVLHDKKRSKLEKAGALTQLSAGRNNLLAALNTPTHCSARSVAVIGLYESLLNYEVTREKTHHFWNYFSNKKRIKQSQTLMTACQVYLLSPNEKDAAFVEFSKTIAKVTQQTRSILFSSGRLHKILANFSTETSQIAVLPPDETAAHASADYAIPFSTLNNYLKSESANPTLDDVKHVTLTWEDIAHFPKLLTTGAALEEFIPTVLGRVTDTTDAQSLEQKAGKTKFKEIVQTVVSDYIVRNDFTGLTAFKEKIERSNSKNFHIEDAFKIPLVKNTPVWTALLDYPLEKILSYSDFLADDKEPFFAAYRAQLTEQAAHCIETRQLSTLKKLKQQLLIPKYTQAAGITDLTFKISPSADEHNRVQEILLACTLSEISEYLEFVADDQSFFEAYYGALLQNSQGPIFNEATLNASLGLDSTHTHCSVATNKAICTLLRRVDPKIVSSGFFACVLKLIVPNSTSNLREAGQAAVTNYIRNSLNTLDAGALLTFKKATEQGAATGISFNFTVAATDQSMLAVLNAILETPVQERDETLFSFLKEISPDFFVAYYSKLAQSDTWHFADKDFAHLELTAESLTKYKEKLNPAQIISSGLLDFALKKVAGNPHSKPLLESCKKIINKHITALIHEHKDITELTAFKKKCQSLCAPLKDAAFQISPDSVNDVLVEKIAAGSLEKDLLGFLNTETFLNFNAVEDKKAFLSALVTSGFLTLFASNGPLSFKNVAQCFVHTLIESVPIPAEILNRFHFNEYGEESSSFHSLHHQQHANITPETLIDSNIISHILHTQLTLAQEQRNSRLLAHCHTEIQNYCRSLAKKTNDLTPNIFSVLNNLLAPFKTDIPDDISKAKLFKLFLEEYFNNTVKGSSLDQLELFVNFILKVSSDGNYSDIFLDDTRKILKDLLSAEITNKLYTYMSSGWSTPSETTLNRIAVIANNVKSSKILSLSENFSELYVTTLINILLENRKVSRSPAEIAVELTTLVAGTTDLYKALVNQSTIKNILIERLKAFNTTDSYIRKVEILRELEKNNVLPLLDNVAQDLKTILGTTAQQFTFWIQCLRHYDSRPDGILEFLKLAQGNLVNTAICPPKDPENDGEYKAEINTKVQAWIKKLSAQELPTLEDFDKLNELSLYAETFETTTKNSLRKTILSLIDKFVTQQVPTATATATAFFTDLFKADTTSSLIPLTKFALPHGSMPEQHFRKLVTAQAMTRAQQCQTLDDFKKLNNILPFCIQPQDTDLKAAIITATQKFASDHSFAKNYADLNTFKSPELATLMSYLDTDTLKKCIEASFTQIVTDGSLQALVTSITSLKTYNLMEAPEIACLIGDGSKFCQIINTTFLKPKQDIHHTIFPTLLSELDQLYAQLSETALTTVKGYVTQYVVLLAKNKCSTLDELKILDGILSRCTVNDPALKGAVSQALTRFTQNYFTQQQYNPDDLISLKQLKNVADQCSLEPAIKTYVGERLTTNATLLFVEKCLHRLEGFCAGDNARNAAIALLGDNTQLAHFVQNTLATWEKFTDPDHKEWVLLDELYAHLENKGDINVTPELSAHINYLVQHNKLTYLVGALDSERSVIKHLLASVNKDVLLENAIVLRVQSILKNTSPDTYASLSSFIADLDKFQLLSDSTRAQVKAVICKHAATPPALTLDTLPQSLKNSETFNVNQLLSFYVNSDSQSQATFMKILTEYTQFLLANTYTETLKVYKDPNLKTNDQRAFRASVYTKKTDANITGGGVPLAKEETSDLKEFDKVDTALQSIAVFMRTVKALKASTEKTDIDKYITTFSGSKELVTAIIEFILDLAVHKESVDIHKYNILEKIQKDSPLFFAPKIARAIKEICRDFIGNLSASPTPQQQKIKNFLENVVYALVNKSPLLDQLKNSTLSSFKSLMSNSNFNKELRLQSQSDVASTTSSASHSPSSSSPKQDESESSFFVTPPDSPSRSRTASSSSSPSSNDPQHVTAARSSSFSSSQPEDELSAEAAFINKSIKLVSMTLSVNESYLKTLKAQLQLKPMPTSLFTYKQVMTHLNLKTDEIAADKQEAAAVYLCLLYLKKQLQDHPDKKDEIMLTLNVLWQLYMKSLPSAVLGGLFHKDPTCFHNAQHLEGSKVFLVDKKSYAPKTLSTLADAIKNAYLITPKEEIQTVYTSFTKEYLPTRHAQEKKESKENKKIRKASKSLFGAGNTDFMSEDDIFGLSSALPTTLLFSMPKSSSITKGHEPPKCDEKKMKTLSDC